MTGFCKSGVMVLMDHNGVYHYFDPNDSIGEVAKYVWNNESLGNYQEEGSKLRNETKRVFAELDKKVFNHRLRLPESIMNDRYYAEIV